MNDKTLGMMIFEDYNKPSMSHPNPPNDIPERKDSPLGDMAASGLFRLPWPSKPVGGKGRPKSGKPRAMARMGRRVSPKKKVF